MRMFVLNYSTPNYTLQDIIYLPENTDRLRPMLSTKQDRIAVTLNTKGFSSIYSSDMKK